MGVGGSNPARDEIVSTAPAAFVLSLNFEVDPSTLQAADLEVYSEGFPVQTADFVSLAADGVTATFTFDLTPVSAQGLQTMHMAAGAVKALPASGLPDLASAEWTASFRYDVTRMEIASTNPNGPLAGVPLRTFDLNLNELVDPDSVSTSDLYLYHDWWGDWYANTVEVLDGDVPGTSKIRFHVPDITDLGNLYAYVGPGSFTDEFGNPSQPFERWYELVTGMAVAGSTPAAGDILGSAPKDFVINFTLPYDPATVDPDGSDLTVNGIAATSRTLTDADTVTFHFSSPPAPAAIEGEWTMHMAAGVVDVDPSIPLSDPGNMEWTGTFRYDAVPMAVVSTAPGVGASVVLPLTTIDVNLNEAVLPSSVQNGDLLLSQGHATGFSLVNGGTTIRYTLAGITSEGTLSASIAAGALADVNGNPNLAFAGTYSLDIGTIPFPTLSPVAPLGSLIQGQTAAGIIGTAGDTDSFTIDVAAGQNVTVLVTPTSTLQPKVTLGSTTVTAEGLGKKALLQTVAVSGPQTITVGSANGTGSHTVQVLLNTALETESNDGAENNTTPQDLNGSFVTVATSTVSAKRGAVMGRTDASEVKELLSTNFNSTSGFSMNGMWHQSIGHRNESGHSATQSMYFGAGEKYQTKGKGGTETFTKGTYEVKAKGKVTPQSGQLTSPSINLAGGGRITVDFNYILQTQGTTDGDLAQLQIKPSTSSTWTTLKSYNGNAESSVWRAVDQVDISSYANQVVQLRFNFVSNSSQNNYEGWYIDDLVVRQTIPHDNYSFSVEEGERVTVALQAAGDVNVLLQNAAGTTTLATGTSGATNLTKMISNHGPLAAGTYRLAVTGQTNTPYTLVVLRGAAFDSESNDSYATAQDFTGVPGVLGHITAGTDLLSLRGTPVIGGLVLAGSKMTLGIASDGSFITGGAGIQFLDNEFVIPGSPVAGFTIGQDGVNFTNKEALGYTEIPVTLEDLSSGTFRGVRIVGTVGSGLQLERVIAFSHNDEFATIATRLTNVSGATISNVAWLENLDPDQGYPLIGDFSTFNDVVLGGQFVRADAQVPDFPGGLTIGMGSADARRVVSAQGFDNRDPFEIINFPSDPNGAFEDIGINLAFNFGTLGAGQSAAGSMIMTFGRTASEAEATYSANTGGTLVADEDWYVHRVDGAGVLHIETSTPGDGAGEPGNKLNPRIEVYGTSSTVPLYFGTPFDGRNEKVHVTGLAPGASYRVRIYAEGGTGGAYFLDPPPPATGEQAPATTSATSPSALALLASAKPTSGTVSKAAKLGPANTAAPKPTSAATLNPAGVDLAMTASPGGSSPSWLNAGSKADLDPSLLDVLSTATARGSKLGAKRAR
jgi:hypothetical protein